MRALRRAQSATRVYCGNARGTTSPLSSHFPLVSRDFPHPRCRLQRSGLLGIRHMYWVIGGSGAAAVESAAVSVVVRSCVWVRWWQGLLVSFVCLIRVPVCVPCVPAPPGVFLLGYRGWTVCHVRQSPPQPRTLLGPLQTIHKEKGGAALPHARHVVVHCMGISVLRLTLAERVAACAVCFAVGAALLFAVGFAHSTTLHNAAHDVRHTFVFPCH